MTGVEFLEQIRNINDIIKGLQEEIENINTLLTNTTVKPKEVDVQTSLPSDPMAEKIIKKVEYEDRIKEYINRQIKIKTEAIALINKIAPEYQGLLIFKYINCKSLKEIAEDMDISIPRVKQRLRDAKTAFNSIYEQWETL